MPSVYFGEFITDLDKYDADGLANLLLEASTAFDEILAEIERRERIAGEDSNDATT